MTIVEKTIRIDNECAKVGGWVERLWRDMFAAPDKRILGLVWEIWMKILFVDVVIDMNRVRWVVRYVMK